MKQNIVKLSDFLIRSKIPIDIVDDKKYKRVKIRTKHQGVSVRDIELGSKIGTKKQFILKGGQFVLSKIDAMYGAFGIAPNEVDGAIITGNFWAYDYDKKQVSIEWLNHFTNSPDFYELCRRASSGNTHRKYLDETFLLSYKVNLPSVEEQRNIVTRIEAVKRNIEKLTAQFSFQHIQIKKLNQAILQEAVQGKLVLQNPKDEHATELLKRIKAEKEKSGKKEKPLPPIKSEEIPFEIPESWVWCRLGDAVDLKRGKSKHRPRNDDRLFTNGVYPFVQTGDVSKAKYNDDLITTVNGYYNDFGLAQSEIQSKGTLCITIAANIAECGFLDFDACVPDSIVCLKAIDSSIEFFVYHYLKLAKADLERYAPATAQKNINLGILNDLLIPFPPLSEQKLIVEEIEKQLNRTKQLKEHIIANQEATEQLLKALLHQAFEVKEENKIPEAKVVEFKSKDNGEYKVTLLAAEIVWQLHKQPTLGHLKLQKIIYLCEKMGDMQLPVNFLRQAMGPYDPQIMRSIDKQLKENKWFEYQQNESLKYKPLEKAGQHKADFEKYFAEEKKGIQYLIDKFIMAKSETIEIVATLYACLDHILKNKEIYSEVLLLKRFYEWSDQKAKFEEKEVKTLFTKMIELGVVPAKFKVNA